MEGGALALPEEPALGCEVVPALLDVVAELQGYKRRHGLLDFGDQITLAQPPVKMGKVEQSQAEHAHAIGEDNQKVFEEFGIQ